MRRQSLPQFLQICRSTTMTKSTSQVATSPPTTRRSITLSLRRKHKPPPTPLLNLSQAGPWREVPPPPRGPQEPSRDFLPLNIFPRPCRSPILSRTQAWSTFRLTGLFICPHFPMRQFHFGQLGPRSITPQYPDNLTGSCCPRPGETFEPKTWHQPACLGPPRIETLTHRMHR